MFAKPSLSPVRQRFFSVAAEHAVATVNPTTTTPAVAQKFVPFDVKSSTLPNGSRVVTVQHDAYSSAVALFVKAGSRYESKTEVGASHFTKYMPFQRTHKRSPIFVVRDMERVTGHFKTATSRDNLVLTAQLQEAMVPSLITLLEDGLSPRFHEYIIRDLVPVVESEASNAEENPNTLFTEVLHQTAFRNVGLGRTLYCPSYRSEKIDPTVLTGYWARRVLNPANHTWVGVGVKHEEFVALAQSVAIPTLPTGQSLKLTADEGKSTYYGGEATVPSDGNTRVGIVFKGLAENDKDAPALAVLSAVTGGDARYTKDGPGRGVTTRLYRNVLQKFDAVQATATLNASYCDTGLWGVYAEAEPGNAQKVAELLTDELSKLKKDGVNPTELTAAKNRVKVQLFKDIDTAEGLAQFLGRKTSSSGTPLSPLELVSRIDKLSVEDVNKVARNVLSTEVTVVALGDVEGLPLAKQLQGRV